MKHGICKKNLEKPENALLKKKFKDVFSTFYFRSSHITIPCYVSILKKMKVCLLRIRKGIQETFRKSIITKKVIKNFQIFVFTYTWHKFGIECKFYELQSERVNTHYLRLTESPLV